MPPNAPQPNVLADQGTGTPDRKSLTREFSRTRDLSVALAAPLNIEDMVVQTMPDVSPTKWHLAHTTWFFETFILKAHDTSYTPSHPDYEYLFNSYYNAVGDQFPRPQRGLLSRPTLSEVLSYRTEIEQKLKDFIADASAQIWETIAPLIELGCHHEQQHQELMLTDIKHVLSWNPLAPVGYPKKTALVEKPEVVPLSFVELGETDLVVGADLGDSAAFSFDCEGPMHRVFLWPHALANRPITNGEYLAFIEDGGYRTPSLWLSDAWSKIKEESWAHPLYWRERDKEWCEFTLHGEEKLDPDKPVSHLSYYEADAYATWAGARLPYEHELERVQQRASGEGHFLNLADLHPRVAPQVTNNSFVQLFGDVWEWTQSSFNAYPGFRPKPGAVGEYNGKFMCNQFVLKGGSCATPAGHIRSSYRNFFPADARWQFTGLRLARDIEPY